MQKVLWTMTQGQDRHLRTINLYYLCRVRGEASNLRASCIVSVFAQLRKR
jgi:hypothetical protein